MRKVKKACVIAFADIGGKKYLFKNRDRNYVPELKIYHTMRNGVEMVYFRDENTGWVEGINEYGIAVANAALLVIWDENEGKASKKTHKTLGMVGSKDAERVLRTLECKTLSEALDIVVSYMGGIRGHTLVSDGKKAYSVEHTAKHKAHVEDLDITKPHVRSNHGIKYPQAGYTSGENKESSHKRLQVVEKTIGEVKTPEELIETLYAQRGENINNPFNVVRKTDNMFTSSQLIYDFAKKGLTLYLVPEDSDFLGMEKTFEGDGKCSVEVKKLGFFEDDGEFEIKPMRLASQSRIVKKANHYQKPMAQWILENTPIEQELLTKGMRWMRESGGGLPYLLELDTYQVDEGSISLKEHPISGDSILTYLVKGVLASVPVEGAERVYTHFTTSHSLRVVDHPTLLGLIG